ncbi:MAG: RloB family protein [Bacteroidales bacterium]
MKRLRHSRPYGRRSRLESTREPAKVFVISTEGLTENIYFQGFNLYADELRIHGRVIIDILEKQDPGDTRSAPEYIVGLLNEYVEDSGIDSDELWIVFDRDRQNNSTDKILQILDHCQQRGYNIALTNPCFELWLLMHVSDLSDYDPAILLENPKDSIRARRRFLEKEVTRHIGGYRKNNLQFGRFIAHLEQAVTNSALQCSIPLDLVNQLGTSVGNLVRAILATRYQDGD